MRSDSQSAAISRSRSYKNEYRAWVASLPPEERARLKKAGVAAPYDDEGVVIHSHGPEITLTSRDAPDSSAASVSPDMALLCDQLRDDLAERFGHAEGDQGSAERWKKVAAYMAARVEEESRRYQSWLMNKLVGALIDAPNPKLSVAGLAFASDIAALNGYSDMAAYARRIGVSRAAVSKSKRYWQTMLDLPESSHGKPAATREKLRRVTRERHWRRRKFKASDLLNPKHKAKT